MLKYILAITLSVLYAGTGSAQNYVCRGDTVYLVKPEVRGDFYWQGSLDGEDWSRIESEPGDTIILRPDQSAWYRVEVFEGYCQVLYSSIIQLELIQLPELTIPKLDSVCVNSQAFVLDGASPIGGIFKGAGIIDGRFIPELAGPGESEYYYLYKDSLEICSDSLFASIIVLPLADEAVAGPDQLEIISDSILLSANSPTVGTGEWKILEGEGGTIMEPGNHNSIFSPGENAGVYMLEWTITNSCSNNSDQLRLEFVETSINPCPGQPFLFDKDGNRYKTIQIGDQCWMGENLKVGTVINSTIKSFPHSNASDNDETEVYAWGNNLDTLALYGGLYDWDEMMDYSEEAASQGICPEGWHVPTREEWEILNDTFEEGNAGSELQATGSSGFDALKGGDRHANGDFFSFASSAFYWTSSSWNYDGRTAGYYIEMISCNDILQRGSFFIKKTGASVRCLKNR